jgi:hypothetical protein
MTSLGDFIAERCIILPDQIVLARDVYDQFLAFIKAKTQADIPLNLRAFNKWFQKECPQFTYRHMNIGHCYVGMTCKQCPLTREKQSRSSEYNKIQYQLIKEKKSSVGSVGLVPIQQWQEKGLGATTLTSQSFIPSVSLAPLIFDVIESDVAPIQNNPVHNTTTANNSTAVSSGSTAATQTPTQTPTQSTQTSTSTLTPASEKTSIDYKSLITPAQALALTQSPPPDVRTSVIILSGSEPPRQIWNPEPIQSPAQVAAQAAALTQTPALTASQPKPPVVRAIAQVPTQTSFRSKPPVIQPSTQASTQSSIPTMPIPVQTPTPAQTSQPPVQDPAMMESPALAEFLANNYLIHPAVKRPQCYHTEFTDPDSSWNLPLPEIPCYVPKGEAPLPVPIGERYIHRGIFAPSDSGDISPRWSPNHSPPPRPPSPISTLKPTFPTLAELKAPIPSPTTYGAENSGLGVARLSQSSGQYDPNDIPGVARISHIIEGYSGRNRSSLLPNSRPPNSRPPNSRLSKRGLANITPRKEPPRLTAEQERQIAISTPYINIDPDADDTETVYRSDDPNVPRPIGPLPGSDPNWQPPPRPGNNLNTPKPVNPPPPRPRFTMMSSR